MAAATVFGIAFEVPGELASKYKEGFGPDLDAASGETHHLLPHPAVDIGKSEGVVLSPT